MLNKLHEWHSAIPKALICHCYLRPMISFPVVTKSGRVQTVSHTLLSLPAPITVPVTQKILNKGLLNKFFLFITLQTPLSLCSQISRAVSYFYIFESVKIVFSKVYCLARISLLI